MDAASWGLWRRLRAHLNQTLPQMPIITFTPAEQSALLHRLECADVFPDVFNDTDGMEHLAALSEAEAADLARQITNYGRAVIDDTPWPERHNEARRAVLIEAIEGSTWIAVHDNNETSTQKLAAARRTLDSLARKVEAALGMDANSITTPEV